MNSENRIDFKMITEISDDLISQTDGKGFFQYISPSCSKVLGYNQESLIGKSAFDYIHRAEQEKVLRMFEKGIALKEDNRIEYRFKHALGNYVWLETRGKILLDPERKVIGAVFNSRDITDRKILQERQKYYFDLSLEMLGTVNKEGYFVEINNIWEQTIGWSIEELLNKPYLSFVHPDDHEATMKIRAQLMVGENTHAFINRYRCKDGSYKWISWNSSRDTQEQHINFVARDVTKQIDEKRNLEKKVIKSESFLRSTIDNIRGVVYHCKNDEKWTMEYLSQGCFELTGYKSEELINNLKMSFGSLVLDKYRNYLVSLTNATYEHEYEVRTKDGETRWVLDRGKTVFSEDGKAIRQEGILTDITDLKQYESAIAESERFLRESQRVGGVGSYVVNLINDTCQSSDVLNEILGLEQKVLHSLEVWSTLIHPHDREVALSAHQKSIEEITNYKQEYRIIRPKDGAVRWLSDVGELELDISGEPSRIVGTIMDITERKQLEENMLQAYDATIEGWAHALDLKDEETEDHSRRVTELTMRIAVKMGIKEEELAHVRRGALLHDIGKMGIPDSILLKPGKLTDEEWKIMRKHPVYGFEMLSHIDYLRPALGIPYCHHEKWDGSGYPRGLKGKQIPLAARIFAVVDVYDALTSDRPYRKAWTKVKTLEHIREQTGSHFDHQIVDVFMKEIGDRV